MPAKKQPNTSVGIFEAKNRLSELVTEVERGATVLLTRNGRPVAELVPVREKNRDADAAMQWLLSRRWSLGGATIRDLIDDGRRY